jgi:hypothetical protein
MKQQIITAYKSINCAAEYSLVWFSGLKLIASGERAS